MDAKLLEERTIFKVGPPAWVERIAFATDFQMPMDADVGWPDQLQPDGFSVANHGNERARVKTLGQPLGYERFLKSRLNPVVAGPAFPRVRDFSGQPGKDIGSYFILFLPDRFR